MNIYDLDFSVDTLKALLWQYNEAKSLQELVRLKDAWTKKHQGEFWQNWFRDVFDIRTANDFGLMVWAIILDYRTFIELPGTTKENFGFGAFNLNFSNGNFGQQGSKSTFLSTAQKRLLLRLRYFQMISRCTVPEINRVLKAVFGEYADVYVSDLNTMDYIVYVFGKTPDADVRFILDNFDILPRPAAVGVRTIVRSRPVFGYGGHNASFNQTTFHGDP